MCMVAEFNIERIPIEMLSFIIVGSKHPLCLMPTIKFPYKFLWAYPPLVGKEPFKPE